MFVYKKRVREVEEHALYGCSKNISSHVRVVNFFRKGIFMYDVYIFMKIISNLPYVALAVDGLIKRGTERRKRKIIIYIITNFRYQRDILNNFNNHIDDFQHDNLRYAYSQHAFSDKCECLIFVPLLLDAIFVSSE